METRKVQVTGGSTYAVSLPKDWVVGSGIEKSDFVNIVPQDDGSLLIAPRGGFARETRKSYFGISDGTEGEHVLRKLIGAYIAGYGEIEVDMKPRMSVDVRSAVRNFSRMTIGTEIIDESSHRMVLRDLLNPSDLPFQKSLRRMYYISRRMLSDSIQAFVNDDQELALDVTTRDVEVDRLNWLMARQYHMTTKNPILAERLGASSTTGINYILISRLIERIADHTCKISRNVQKLKNQKTPAGFSKEIGNVGHKAMESYDQAVEALFKGDLDDLNEIIDQVYLEIAECERIAEKVSKWGKEGAIPLSNIVESIRRILSYSNNIAEVAINHLVDDSN